MLYFYKSLREMQKTPEELLKKGVFENTELIDSIGDSYHILSYRGLWGFHPMLKGTSIMVRFTFEKTNSSTYEEVKQFILEKVNTKGSRLLWGRTRQEIIEMLDEAQTIEELFISVK